jgi:PIN domain nuclease of toxin-antitoxin system
MSCVNVAKVVGWLAERGLPEVEAKRIMLSRNLAVVALDFRAACCWGDRAWAELDLGVEIRVIR